MRHGARLETPRILVRPWRENDLEAFHRLNSDEQVMEFFPYRRDREESLAVMRDMNRRSRRDGFGWAAAEDKATGAVIGIVGLSRVAPGDGLPPGVETGWRFVPESWGKGLATEAAQAIVDHGFVDFGLDEIVAFAVEGNAASIAVMRRLGMEDDVRSAFDHPRVP
ncbi:MAG TPA: GNAT family N-acetyltransferase, partial [Rhizobiaceae bacterium]|nr:GNAT family N-acetyltransferase [Rhizobiaceae bacterium]